MARKTIGGHGPSSQSGTDTQCYNRQPVVYPLVMLPIPVPVWERLLWASNIAGLALLLVRLRASQLHRTYKFFFLYLLVLLGRSLLLLAFDPNANRYAVIWMLTEPLAWLLYVLVVLELYGLVLQKYKGIATLGRWTLLGALAVSILVSLLTLFPSLSPAGGRYPILLFYTLVKRGVISSLAVFLLLITAFLVWYPVPLSRNIVLYATVYFVYFLCSTTALFIRYVSGHEVTRTVSTVLLGVENACLFVWILFLNQAGEARTVVIAHQWRLEDEERLSEQLNAINATLLRTARKS